MINSLRKNYKGIILMFISSICVCTGQMFWKLYVSGHILYLLLGFGLYGVGAFIMIIAYKFGSLSVLQPMLSLNYIFTVLLAYFVLDEIISLSTIIGIILVFIGVLLIGTGDE